MKPNTRLELFASSRHPDLLVTITQVSPCGRASGDVASQSKLEVVIRDMLTGLSKFSAFIIPYLAPPPTAVPLAAK